MPEADFKSKIKDIEQRLRKVESLLKLPGQFDALRKEFDDEFRALNKQLTPLYDKDAELENRLKALDVINANIAKLQKGLDKLSGSIDGVRKEFDAEIRSVSKEIAPLFDKDIELDKKIKSIDRTDDEIVSTIDKLQSTLAGVNGKVSAMERTWNTTTLKGVVNNIEAITKALASLERKSTDVVRKLYKTNAGVVAISQHASDIEAEHKDAKFASEELSRKADNLKETVDSFFGQIDAVDGKLNANAAALSDLTSAAEALKDRIETIEAKAPDAAQLKMMLDEQSKMLDQLAQRLTYLEKITVKTIVLE